MIQPALSPTPSSAAASQSPPKQDTQPLEADSSDQSSHTPDSIMWAASLPVPPTLNMNSRGENQILADVARQKARNERRDSLEALNRKSTSLSTTTSEDFERSDSNLSKESGLPGRRSRASSTATTRSTGEKVSGLFSTLKQKLTRSSSLPGSPSGSDYGDYESDASARTEPRKGRKRDRVRRKLSHVTSPSFYFDSIAVTYPAANVYVPVIF